METFNERYAQIVDDTMRAALASYRRSFKGGFARPSTHARPISAVDTPPHLIGALAAHADGRALLREAKVVERLTAKLRQHSPTIAATTTTMMTAAATTTTTMTAAKINVLKAALLALGHLVGAIQSG